MKRVDFEREARRLEREARRLRKRAKHELRKFLKQQKTTKALARYYRVSESTIERRIKHYGLTGLRKRGRKPFVKKPKFPMPREKWVPVKKYIDELDKKYHFVNIKYPNFKFVNPKTLVCSNVRKDPKGKFAVVGMYFIILESDVFLIYYTRIRYPKYPEPADFEEVYAWIKENAFDMLTTMYLGAAFSIERIIAFTFLPLSGKKPQQLVLESALVRR